MRLFFVTYWSASDGISQATVLPHLKVLQELGVNELDYFSLENDPTPRLQLDGPSHIPLGPYLGLRRRKALQWLLVQAELLGWAKKLRPDLLVCRGAMAGGIGVYLYKRLGLPFVVESFEPHADYMTESGTWSRWGLRSLVQRVNERNIKRYAWRIVTVSEGYRHQLCCHEALPDTRVLCVPCTVDVKHFNFDPDARAKIRRRLGLDHSSKVGIYVGKFGDIYYDRECLELFGIANQLLRDEFFLIILSPDSPERIYGDLAKVGLNSTSAFVAQVSHGEVADFLSAADFAVCPVRRSPAKRFCSPIKNGEYWASGLPILISENIGDDSEIIRTEGRGGVLVDFECRDSMEAGIRAVVQSLGLSGRAAIRELALKYRGRHRVVEAYGVLLREMQQIKRRQAQVTGSLERRDQGR